MEARTSIGTSATRFTVLVAAVAAVMLALAGPGSAKATGSYRDAANTNRANAWSRTVACQGGGGGGCTFAVPKEAG